jgi:hypothetical protein
MSYVCSDCGKNHDELPRFFMWRVPENSAGKTLAVEEDAKSMCRSADGRHFVHCEVELALHEPKGMVLGFICWVEVSPDAYEQLLKLQKSRSRLRSYDGLIEGRLANPVHGIRGSFGTKVRFKAIKGDPTPYIKWAPARSSLGRKMKSGASPKFWHVVVAEVLGEDHG